jgi:hypothetical protein
VEVHRVVRRLHCEDQGIKKSGKSRRKENVLFTVRASGAHIYNRHISGLPNNADIAVMLYTYIRETLGSNLGRDTGYPD